MRFLTPLLLVPLAACGVACPGPDEVNGTYAVFANVMDRDGNGLDNFPADTTPVNGWSEWHILWDPTAGGMVVTIDQQVFNAGGSWSNVECGVFSLIFSGDYEKGGDSHVFNADGDFQLSGPHLEGTWTWDETWADDAGHQGDLTAHGQVQGDRIGTDTGS